MSTEYLPENCSPPSDRAARILSEMVGTLAAGYEMASPAFPAAKMFHDMPEWRLLVGDSVQATPDSSGHNSEVEAQRTSLTLNCAVDVYRGDMRRLPGLSPEDQQHLAEQMRAAIPDQETLTAFLYLLLTHDVGKNQEIARAVGADSGIDHDEVYARLATDPAHLEARRRFLPTFELLSRKGQQLIIKIAGIQSNYPQSLQGEAPAATLKDIHEEPDRQAVLLDILKAKFDIFGAAGHVNPDQSITATSATYRRMRNQDAAWLDPHLPDPIARNNAFLDAEIAYFTGRSSIDNPEELAGLRALALLELRLRLTTPEEFTALVSNFNQLPNVAQTVLVHELNRSTHATLAYYSPILLRTLAKREGDMFAMEYFAHILQEAHIADQKARRDGLEGIAAVQVEGLVRGLSDGTFNPRETAVRFVPVDGALVAEPQPKSLHDIENVPVFAEGDALRGKRIMVIGVGGGSDSLQACKTGRLLQQKYGCEVAAVVSARNANRKVRQTGETIGQATQRITAETNAIGDWRFLEKIPLEDDPQTPVYFLNSTNPQTVTSDIRALYQHLAADVIIGVDTGGDSLYKSEHPSFSAHLPTDITPDHDYSVIQGLSSTGLPAFMAIVAPGVDSPLYAREVLDEIGAQKIPLSADDVATIQRTYAQWRMDGSGSEEGRYGKTPLAWLHALAGRTGFQHLDLPSVNVTSDTNPWRAFTVITPAMGGIVISDLQRHFEAIRRPAPDAPKP